MSLFTVIKALKSNKIKTALIYVSLVVTIVSIFLITSISQGIISMYSNMLKGDGNIIVTQAKISDTFFSNVDRTLIPKIASLQNIKQVSALIVGASPVEKLPIVAIYGASKNMFSKYRLTQGNYPKAQEVIIGNSIFTQLDNKDEIQIANELFRVSGVFESDIGFENGGVIMNISDAGKIFNKSASMFLIDTDFEANIENIIAQIQKLSPDIDVKSTQNFVDNYNQFKIINKSSLIISFVAFIMGLIAIASIMSITVMQRKDEFGIMKAIGIASKKILFSIILEGLVIAVVAFFTAYIFSNIVLYIISHIQTLQGYVNGEITLTLTLYVLLTTVLMTILGSLIPVYTALKVDPVTLIQRGN